MLIGALYALPKPLVAAVTGAAVAGGCILALTADHRILGQGSPIGLNEVRVGVPLPWWVLTLLRASISPSALTRAALLGDNYTDEEALAVGLALVLDGEIALSALACPNLGPGLDGDRGAGEPRVDLPPYHHGG